MSPLTTTEHGTCSGIGDPALQQHDRWDKSFRWATGDPKGNILIDPSLPIEGLNVDLILVSFKYGRVFDFFGRSAKSEALLPLAPGHSEGLLADVGPRERDDMKDKVFVFFLGVTAAGGYNSLRG